MESVSRFQRSHRRFNPLRGEWVLVSPQRDGRPWQGQVERVSRETPLAHDPSCYLCPGNERAGGKRNPDYQDTFVFDNDFPALLPDSAPADVVGTDLLRSSVERGLCRVVCFSPRHDASLSQMPLSGVRRVVDVLAEQTTELGALDFVNHVQLFENRGAAMGASSPHPHCQIWATESIPSEPAKELMALSRYLQTRGRCLLCDYLEVELSAKERVVLQNDHFVAVVPFWAVWPYEVMLLSRRHVGSLPDLRDSERYALAEIVKRLTVSYDALFGVMFPYSMGFHQAPTDGHPHSEAHLHGHYYPPLLRSATVRKFMVGFELLGEPQRDLTPELAAERLRQTVAGVEGVLGTENE